MSRGRWIVMNRAITTEQVNPPRVKRKTMLVRDLGERTDGALSAGCSGGEANVVGEDEEDFGAGLRGFGDVG